MTREEEIQRKAGDLADFGISHRQPDQQQYYEGFIDGAKWADQHPRKGLWDAEKVITWIALHAELYGGFNQGKLNSMCEDLRKAMED